MTTELLGRHETIVRAYVLNGLKYRPFPLDDLLNDAAEQFGYERDEVLAVGKWLNVVEKKVHGRLYWMRPSNVFAIWWGKRPAHYYERQRTSEYGGAA